MNKQWVSIFVAALFEIGWVIGLKHANSVLEWLGTAIAIFISFYLLIKAGESLPVGTVYAVFVGLGTAGTVLADSLLFGEPWKLAKIASILVLLAGVVGLKLLTGEPADKRGEIIMAWIALVVAGLCEMMGVFMISKYNDKKNAQNLVLLILAFTLSFAGLAFAMLTLPMGTAYAIWTGIGAAGGSVTWYVIFQ